MAFFLRLIHPRVGPGIFHGSSWRACCVRLIYIYLSFCFVLRSVKEIELCEHCSIKWFFDLKRKSAMVLCKKLH